MINEHHAVAAGRFDADSYRDAQISDQSLNAAILRAEIASSYEEFLDVFERFYADDVEVSAAIRARHSAERRKRARFSSTFWSRFT